MNKKTLQKLPFFVFKCNHISSLNQQVVDRLVLRIKIMLSKFAEVRGIGRDL